MSGSNLRIDIILRFQVGIVCVLKTDRTLQPKNPTQKIISIPVCLFATAGTPSPSFPSIAFVVAIAGGYAPYRPL